ncbi:hypothetical protein L249_7996 [Ophiocordyceps polyrhachis-furcata BCC 54312]|uniref:Uncharacterized protein n=1 Tax=Ophiocordyceps polyrhachis-furcata BCC 54312 TaxID=1330021 RepID=A0A367LHW4_9HYPO|nr:hypothetical protein L249_7996 [Ophiocordyceps polyrhachis-furcata BCC 54312]
MVEPQLKPDSLGYLWAALATFVRSGSGSEQDASSEAGVRDAAKLVSKRPQFQSFVPSDQANFGSSPRLQANESYPSVGYVEGVAAPLIEGATIRLASCFTRCVPNSTLGGVVLDRIPACWLLITSSISTIMAVLLFALMPTDPNYMCWPKWWDRRWLYDAQIPPQSLLPITFC